MLEISKISAKPFREQSCPDAVSTYRNRLYFLCNFLPNDEETIVQIPETMVALPIGKRRREERPLQERVNQILSQRGALRDITEASLRQEVEARKAKAITGEIHEQRVEDVDEEPETQAAREEELWKRKNEMLAQLAYVLWLL